MRKVLVVDDEFLVRVGIKSFLNWEENGYTIIGEAADGKQALEIMERELPDVVLTDLKMDGMDGFELIQVSRKRFPTVQFVVLSSFEDGENVKRAMKLGAADYIFKLTSKPEELLRILNELPYEQPENEAEKLLRKNRSAIKQRLIRMAAQRSYPYRAELQEEFRQMELKTEFQKPFCVLLSRFSREIHEKDSAVLRYAMENMTQEVFEGGLCTETYPYTANSILVIVQQTGTMQPIEQIRRTFSRLYEYAARYLGLHLEGCLSTVHTGMEQFSDALTECERTLDRHLPHAEGELQQYSGETRAEIVAVKRYDRQGRGRAMQHERKLFLPPVQKGDGNQLCGLREHAARVPCGGAAAHERQTHQRDCAGSRCGKLQLLQCDVPQNARYFSAGVS